MIEKHKLKKGCYYTGTCRNTNIAQWDDEKFIFIGNCMGSPYIETIPYYGDVKNINTDGFMPIKEIVVDYIDIKSVRIEQDYKNGARNIYKKTNLIDIKDEIWKPIVGFDNYAVSNMGRIKSIKLNRILSQSFSRGYLILGLTTNKGIKKTVRVHRLVLMTFKPRKFYRKIESNHVNGIKTDNRESNLEWTSHKENSRKMYVSGLYNKKLSAEDVIEIKKLLLEGISGKSIAKLFNVGCSIISEINKGKKWRLI
jgi:hypothetical protein